MDTYLSEVVETMIFIIIPKQNILFHLSAGILMKMICAIFAKKLSRVEDSE